MEKHTKLSVQWFYNLLMNGECELLDFKEQLSDKISFGKSYKGFSPKYDELAKDVVAFANKKGGFLFIGIVDDTKEISKEFKYDSLKIFELIRQIQDRTIPSITLISHELTVEETKLLVLEIPFSNQLHRTSKGEYLIRSNDGNRAIEAHEMNTILSEKGLLVYDQKTWQLEIQSTENDAQGNPIPGWQDIISTRDLYTRIRKNRPNSPYLKK